MASNPPAAADVLRVTIYCTALGQYSQNIGLFYVTGTSGGGLSLLEIAQGEYNIVETLLPPTMPTNAALYAVRVQGIYPAPRTNYFTAVGPTPGTVAGTNLAPPQVAPLISILSNKVAGGRGVRGRHFMPFTARDNLGAGVLTAGAITNYTAFSAYYTGVHNLSVVGKTTDLKMVLRDEVPLSWDVVGATVHTQISQHKTRSLYRHGDVPPS